jgi:methionine-rich copper-binding protein CopC
MKRCLLLVVSLIALAASALAHSSLVRSEPKEGATLKQAPNEIRMWFTEPIKAGLSSIEVRDAAGKQIDQRDLHADEKEPALVRLALPANLGPGAYKVIWSAVAQDLHVARGSFSFRVSP